MEVYINLETELKAYKAKRKHQLTPKKSNSSKVVNSYLQANTLSGLHLDMISNTEHIYHIDDIYQLCVDYRLRFLDAQYFKGEFPEACIDKIKQLELRYNTTLNEFKIVAPSTLFFLKKQDDPILLTPLGDNYYYLIHQWGGEINTFRKWYAWPFKHPKNLLFVLLFISTFLTAFTYKAFTIELDNFGYLLCLWLFHVKGIVGITLFWGISSGKNFSKYCWTSIYNKV